MPPPADDPPSSCPIDPAARTAWLENAQRSPHPLRTTPPASSPPLIKTRPLAHDRETSSIPRAPSSSNPPAADPSSPPTQAPSHHHHPPPTPATASASASASASAAATAEASSQTQNWIYPSERQFYDALVRKQRAPEPSAVASIVPIHNAVNERAWRTILAEWELRSPAARKANGVCGGPRLRSFSGDSGRLTPRARVYGWLGYERPFDRHDWVVERCGGEAVEYVIDFYRGKGGGLSFFLDVRPKLNSWAGWKLRLGRWVGL